MRKLRCSIKSSGQSRLLAVHVETFKYRLDFMPLGSVCVSMDISNRDRIAERFADLTATSEDAAGLAVSGQSPDLSETDAERLVAELWRTLICSVEILANIEQELHQETGLRA